jgi:hypothetical protein
MLTVALHSPAKMPDKLCLSVQNAPRDRNQSDGGTQTDPSNTTNPPTGGH